MKTVLIIGGSQGAHQINLAVHECLKQLLEVAQVFHITGERDYAWLEHEREKLSDTVAGHYHLAPYLNLELADAYRAADLIISRASANVMAEIAAVGKPSILIPGQLAGGHQLKNAQVYGREGAASIIRPEELSGAVLYKEVTKELSQPDELAMKGRRAKALSEPKAAYEIAKGILELAGARH